MEFIYRCLLIYPLISFNPFSKYPQCLLFVEVLVIEGLVCFIIFVELNFLIFLLVLDLDGWDCRFNRKLLLFIII
jgi:hypothetical protein